MPAGVLPPPGSQPGQDTTGYQDEPKFVAAVATATGLDPRVIYAWASAEGAYAPNGTGHFNYLNLRAAQGDVGVIGQTSGRFDEFGNWQDAATSTINRIKQPFLWSQPELGTPGLGAVVQAKGSPSQEIAAIGRSGWDTGHYAESGGAPGSRLLAIFENQYGVKAAGAPPIAGSTPTSPGGTPGGSFPNPLSGITGIATAIENFVKFITSVRLLELVGGLALVLVGLIILAKTITGTKTGAAVAGVVGGPVKAAFTKPSAAPSAPISQQPRSVQRRAGFEGVGNRNYQRAQRARARQRAAAARGPGELPADL